MNSRKWLEEISWDLVVWQNLQLCNDKHAHHGPTSDGHAACRELWETARPQAMTLDEMVQVCRKCHRLAPFTNYNGNTFAAIARALIEGLGLPREHPLSHGALLATSSPGWRARRRSGRLRNSVPRSGEMRRQDKDSGQDAPTTAWSETLQPLGV
ncbi:MAG: hypothetical protein ABIT37_18215 [Luteolibacter sp.]